MLADLYSSARFTGINQMPKVAPYSGAIPQELVSFNRARSKKKFVSAPDTAIHFYEFDRFFNCVWQNPQRYLPMLRKYGYVLSPDYSMYINMPLPEVVWNSYRNKLLAYYLQQQGLNVIPNVSWSRENTLAICLDGWPKDSIIAINSTGIGKDSFSKYVFKKGYEKVLETLCPKKIIRYGAKQDCEIAEISVYFPNDNLKAANNGSKRVI